MRADCTTHMMLSIWIPFLALDRGPDEYRRMENSDVSTVLERLRLALRERLDPMGYVEHEGGGFQTGHAPQIAPAAYNCVWYPGLDDEGLRVAEEEAARPIPEACKTLLRMMNGCRILGVSLQGAMGRRVERSVGPGIGQPISISYNNIDYTRRDDIPLGHFGIGAMNGGRSSQGVLYLASTGQVEMYHSKLDLIGKTWPSLAAFLEEEMFRRFSLYDEEGRQRAQADLLPGDTGDWEESAKAAKAAARGLENPHGLLARLLGRD